MTTPLALRIVAGRLELIGRPERRRYARAMTVRVMLGLAVIALGFGLAALAGLPALIEDRDVGNVVVVAGLALAGAGAILLILGLPAEVRAWREREAFKRRRAADEATDIANLKVKRRRIQHTKADALVRLVEARGAVERYRKARDNAALRSEQRIVRSLELENLIIDANLDFNANEFIRHGASVDEFDNDRAS